LPIVTLLHLLVISAGAWLLGLIYRRWILRGAKGAVVLGLGALGIAVAIGSLLVPFNVRGSNPQFLANLVFQQTQHAVSIGLRWLFVAFLAWVAFRGIRAMLVTRGERSKVWQPAEHLQLAIGLRERSRHPNATPESSEHDLAEAEFQEVLSKVGPKLEANYIQMTRNRRLTVRFGQGFAVPFTAGILNPVIHCPRWITEHEDGRFLRILLDHEVLRIQKHLHVIRLSLVALVTVLPPLGPWVKGVFHLLESRLNGETATMAGEGGQALLAEAMAAISKGVESGGPEMVGSAQAPTGLATSSGNAERSRMGNAIPGGVLVLGLILLVAWSSWVGPVRLVSGLSFGKGHLPNYFEKDAGSVLRTDSLPWRGGLGTLANYAPDGLRVDSRKCGSIVKIIMVLPSSADRAAFLRFRLRYRIVGNSGTKRPFVFSRCMNYTAVKLSETQRSELTPWDSDGSELPSDSGHIEVTLGHDPSGTAFQISRVGFYIPPGVVAEFTEFEVLEGKTCPPGFQPRGADGMNRLVAWAGRVPPRRYLPASLAWDDGEEDF